MCTVSVVPAAGDRPLRLVCNRDELRTRAASLPPRARVVDGRRVLMPVDPSSDGTWIGANDAGVVASLLNATAEAGQHARYLGRATRGTIVAHVLGGGGFAGSLERARGLDAGHYPPFRLLLLDRGLYSVVASDGGSLTVLSARLLNEPLVLASSGLGDELVRQVRSDLFDRLVRSAPDPIAGQAKYHGHHWPERGHLSVLMARGDARTQSQTAIDLSAAGATMRYRLVLDTLAVEAPGPAGDVTLALATA